MRMSHYGFNTEFAVGYFSVLRCTLPGMRTPFTLRFIRSPIPTLTSVLRGNTVLNLVTYGPSPDRSTSFYVNSKTDATFQMFGLKLIRSPLTFHLFVHYTLSRTIRMFFYF